MITKRINVKLTKIPEGGEVHLFGSFHPDFWKNQPMTEKYIVTEVGQELSFKSTDEVWIMTHCNTVTCSPGDFEFDYQIVVIDTPVEEFPEWSVIITIYIGFAMMIIAFLYFEWRTLYKCL